MKLVFIVFLMISPYSDLVLGIVELRAESGPSNSSKDIPARPSHVFEHNCYTNSVVNVFS